MPATMTHESSSEQQASTFALHRPGSACRAVLLPLLARQRPMNSPPMSMFSEGSPDGKGRADEQHDAYGEIVGIMAAARCGRHMCHNPARRVDDGEAGNRFTRPYRACRCVPPAPPADRRAGLPAGIGVNALDDPEAPTWLGTRPEGRLAVNAARRATDIVAAFRRQKGNGAGLETPAPLKRT